METPNAIFDIGINVSDNKFPGVKNCLIFGRQND